MDPIALYYPYIHVRDNAWLKYAALYWPKLGRVRPRDYPTNDSALARKLADELGWLVDVSPDPAVAAVSHPFLGLLQRHSASLHRRFALERIDGWAAHRWSGDHSAGGNAGQAGEGYDLDQRLGYVHLAKVSEQLADQVVAAGLAVRRPGRGGMWLGMHPQLANVYTCALTERLASIDLLHPVTDQPLPHVALSGWTTDRLAEVLLGESLGSPKPGDVIDAFVLMSFETVVPGNLDAVPIDKIIEIRRQFGPELDAFRQHVATAVEGLTRLNDVPDAAVFQAYVRDAVEGAVRSKLDDLRRKLRGLNVTPARALMNVKSLAPPTLVGIAANAAGVSPAVTAPAVLAATVVGVAANLRQDRRAAIAESPVGYLFHVDRKLNPAGLLDRVRRHLTS